MAGSNQAAPYSLDLVERVVLPGVARADACRAPTDVINCEHEAIQARAAELVRGCRDDVDRGQALFEFVRDGIRYDIAPRFESRASWLASDTLSRGSGFCQQKAVLLAALGRAAGIPTALCYSHIRDHKLLDSRYGNLIPDGVILFHGFNALWLGERWVKADATLERSLVQRRGYILVELERCEDGARDAMLPKSDLSGAPHFDVLGEVGPFANLAEGISEAALAIAPTWNAMQSLSSPSGRVSGSDDETHC